jgi:hypothetical protein
MNRMRVGIIEIPHLSDVLMRLYWADLLCTGCIPASKTDTVQAFQHPPLSVYLLDCWFCESTNEEELFNWP